MDKPTRNLISNATQAARRLLEQELGEQLEGTFDILPDGTVGQSGAAHLGPADRLGQTKILAVLAHKQAAGKSPAEAVADYLRETAFTCLNRFVALKMLEARGLVRECVSRGDASSGFREFCGLAPGLASLLDRGYRTYIETVFDELSTEIKVLFDRHDPASLLWPRRQALVDLLEILNTPELSDIWVEDETIGWVYQYFNSADERKKMREESQAPRNSHDLAVRNQFFTPRYVVEFLTDNTLGRTWFEMRGGETALADRCAYLVHSPEAVSGRPKKDPRDIKLLDPAGGSGHFLLYAFDLFLTIYQEGWQDQGGPSSKLTGHSLREDFPDLDALRRAVPALILQHNLYAVDIDPRCVQIAALALWMRAQRAFRDLGLPANELTPIGRINVVVAEPMPGDKALVDRFAASLEPPLLCNLFKKMAGEMQLAGELGTLLRVEEGIAAELKRAREQFVAREKVKRTGFLPGMEPPYRQGELDLSGVDDAQFFHEAEEQFVEALRRFAEAAAGGGGVRRRLFAGDAAQGVALIDLLQCCFDVVLMNPPFGQPTDRTYDYIRSSYSGAHADIFASFVRRGRELAPGGFVGAITSRSFLLAPRLEAFRINDIVPALELLADLGLGVMDAARVESAAFVLGGGTKPGFLALDCRAGRDVVPGSLSSARFLGAGYSVARSTLAVLPQCKILYSLPAAIARLLQESTPFEPEVGTAREGMKSFENDRFIRLAWEVSPSRIGRDRPWQRFAKGGSHAFFYAPLPLLLNWEFFGRELQAVNERINGSTAQVRQASDYWFRPGVTYSKRSAKGFSARCLPADVVFSSNGPAVLPTSGVAAEVILGWLNSRPVRALLHLQSNFGDFSTGAIKRLPWADLHGDTLDHLKTQTRALLRKLVSLDQLSETSPHFAGPALLSLGASGQAELENAYLAAESMKHEVLAAWDAHVASAYGCSDMAWTEEVLSVGDRSDDSDVIERENSPDEGDGEDDESAAPALPTRAAHLLSWSVGVALGRLDVRVPSRGRRLATDFDAFDPIPACSPAMLTDDRGLPVEAAPPGYPLTLPTGGLLVDDQGHASDLAAAVRSVFDVVFAADAEARWGEAAALLDPNNRELRKWLARDFFGHHIKCYSKSRRKAPIYWQLATPSASYSVWLYYHRFTRDTMHRALNDFVVPKLKHEECKLASLSEDAGPNPTVIQRKEIAEQEAFVDELRAFRDEVARVAPLWNPNLDDGVIIHFAPLWRLVPQHKAWQKECSGCWDKLVAGEYDWAHLAMHYWPERVVPKCGTDRSLAITHGLEEVFWEEGEGGKWQSRPVSQARVEELVRARTSPAVKAALQSLLDAPAASSGRGPRAPRRPKLARETTRSARPVSEPAQDVQVARGPAADDQTQRAVRDAIAATPGGANRGEVMVSTGISTTEWNAAITALLQQGEVVKTGERRSTRYFVKGGQSA